MTNDESGSKPVGPHLGTTGEPAPADHQVRLLSSILSSMVDFAYAFDKQGRFLYANQALLNLWGLRLEEVLGKTFSDLSYSPALAARLEQQIQQVIGSCRPVSGETDYTSPLGIGGYYEYIFTPIIAADGTVEAVAGTTRDISHRKQSELEREKLQHALEAERAQLSEIIERAPALICMLSGPEHVFELANPEFHRLIGRDGIIGRTVRQVFPEVEGQGFFELLDSVYRTGTPFVGTERPINLRRLPGGVSDTRLLNFVYQPLRDCNNLVTGIFVHGVDVTELVRAREAIRESETRFRELADAMPQIVWTARADGVLDYYNRRWFEYIGLLAPAVSATPPADATWDRYIHPDDLPKVYQRWVHSIQTGEDYSIEFRVRRADGEYRWFLVRALPARDAVGKVSRWYGTCTDTHDRKLADEMLRHAKEAAESANRSKDRHLAFLAHELRGPLTPALLSAAAMAGDSQLPAEVRSDAALIRRNIELATRLADDLLDANRIALGKLDIRLETIDVHETLRASVAMCSADAQARDLRVKLDLLASECTTQADPAKLTQVWNNLLKNAAKFTHAGGQITVRTSNPKFGQICVEVIDTGVGVSADLLPRMFNLYEQGEHHANGEYVGLGLGLAICKGIIDAHGGTISANSGGKGHGTTITVELQTVGATKAVPLPTRAIPPQRPEKESAGLSILLVDDHEDTLRIMARLLGGLQHRVTTATSVGEALSAAHHGEFDLLISDLGLGDGSGLDLMREILKRRPIRGIALTGYGTDENVRETREAGFVAHVTKPVDFDELQALILKVGS